MLLIDWTLWNEKLGFMINFRENYNWLWNCVKIIEMNRGSQKLW
jgi:hypothetical protein